MRYTGGCLCGAVRWAVEAEPLNERVCHCGSCQKAVGSAFYARLLFRAEDVVLSGEAATYPSSPELLRGFCPRCGTTLFARRDDKGVIGLSAGSLDDPATFRPTEHIWVSAKQPWLVLADGLTQHADGTP